MNQPYNRIRVLICDDHEMVREGLQVILKKIPELEVVGEASGGQTLLTATRRLLPDVILTDVRMPDMSGVEATRLIKQQWPHIGIIALSSFDEESLILDMLNAGAKGYLLKNASKQELTEAVQAAYRDEPYYCRHTNQKLSSLLVRGHLQEGRSHIRNLFTERERQVIELICEGLSSKEIAARLELKTRTVERYRDAIMSKMEVRNAAAVVRFAVENGLYQKPK
jgi:DNA-binding NarL/FixJ family response regulator